MEAQLVQAVDDARITAAAALMLKRRRSGFAKKSKHLLLLISTRVFWDISISCHVRVETIFSCFGD